MLSGNQLAIAITAVLAAAILIGWVLHWLWLFLSREPRTDSARMEVLINRLHEADHAREEAEKARDLAEAMRARRKAETKAQLDEMQARMDGVIGEREAKLEQALREARVDAETSMAGLRNARQRIMALEAEIEEMLREKS